MYLLAFLKELHAKGVDLFLHQQGLDTSTPSGRAMFQMMGGFAEFEHAMIRERVRAGLARAREEGMKLGRKSLEDTDAAKVAAIRAMRDKGTGIRRIARELSSGSVRCCGSQRARKALRADRLRYFMAPCSPGRANSPAASSSSMAARVS
jgi:DNA invertase Pin-like site-specific DNA recombinase